MQEMQVQSPEGEAPLEKETQPTPVLLPGKSQGRRRATCWAAWWVHGVTRVGHDRSDETTTSKTTAPTPAFETAQRQMVGLHLILTADCRVTGVSLTFKIKSLETKLCNDWLKKINSVITNEVICCWMFAPKGCVTK